MKKHILFALFTCLQLMAQNPFDQANKMYKDGNYQEAINLYQDILKKEHSPELYFNLANAYFKTNKVADAIYYYEKSLKLDPEDEEVKNNLLFAKKRTIDEIKEVPKVGFSHFVHDYTKVYTADTWAVVSVVFGFVMLLFFLVYYFKENKTAKRFYFAGMFAAFFLSILTTFAGYFEKSFEQNNKEAILFSEEQAVSAEPKGNAAVIINIHEGTKVYILEKLDNYYKISLTDGTEGWILSSSAKEI